MHLQAINGSSAGVPHALNLRETALTITLKKSDTTIIGLPTLVERMPIKARRVRFLRNLDAQFSGLILAVSLRNYGTFKLLLRELTEALHKRLKLARVLYKLYRITGERINDMDDFLDGDIVVCCCQYEAFEDVGYNVNVKELQLLQIQVEQLQRKQLAQQSSIGFEGNLTDLQPSHMPAVGCYFNIGARICGSKSTALFKACSKKAASNVSCIIKVVDKRKKSKEFMESALSEFACLRQLQTHDNMLELYFSLEHVWLFYIVVECMDADLFDMLKRLGPFTEPQAAAVMRQVGAGLQHMHQLEFVHRDIKLENILTRAVANNPLAIIKIGDFGLAMRCGNKQLKQRCGTVPYMAPELIIGHSYSYPVDAWALGVLLYYLLCYEMPFGEQCAVNTEIFDVVLYEQYQLKPDMEHLLSSQVKNLLVGLLQKQPKRRLTIKQVLESSFVRNAGKA